jgi:hypothetical protein
MKAFIIGLIVLAIAAAGGFYWYSTKARESGSVNQVYKTESVTRTGVLQKVQNTAGVDYTHQIVSEGKMYGVNSYSENLDQYIGKKVEATGQNSGTTLYIDSIKVLP